MQPRSAVVLYRKIWKTLPLKAQLCRLWRQRRGRQLLLALQPAERLVCRRRTRRIGSHGQQLQPGRSMGKHIVRLRRRAVRLQFQERTRHGLCRFRHVEIQHRHRQSFGRFRLLVVELGARLRRACRRRIPPHLKSQPVARGRFRPAGRPHRQRHQFLAAARRYTALFRRSPLTRASLLSC